MTKLIEPIDSAATRGARGQSIADHHSMFPSEWRRRFIARFSERMRSSGYDNEIDLADLSNQHAFAAWGSREPDDTPEQIADGEFEALSDSL